MKLFRRLLFLLLVGSASSLFAQNLVNIKLGGAQRDVARGAVQTPLGDYVVAGYSFSNPNGGGKADIVVTRIDKNGNKVWENYFGGRNHDMASDVIMARDGKFVIAGFTSESSSDNKTVSTKGWIICLNPKGQIEWQYTSYGDKAERVNSVAQAADGGFYFSGLTQSRTKGKEDMWVGKLDQTGKLRWEKRFGGALEDKGNGVVASKYGGCIAVGSTKSEGQGESDMMITRVGEDGSMLWYKVLGGIDKDEAMSVTETPEGKIVVSGWTNSKGFGKSDAELIFMNKDGSIVWDKTFGKAGNDAFSSVINTPDGNLIMSGYTTPLSASESNLWVVKTDHKGNVFWDKSSSGDKEEFTYSIQPLREGGYLLAGFTNNETAGESDMWLITMSNLGVYKANVPSIDIAHNNKPARPQPQPPKKETKPTKPSEMENWMKPNLYILAVGVSEYSDNKYNLTFAHTDADSVADMFATMKGKLFNKVEVKKLLNKDATLVNIKTAINWLEEQATQKDLIVMFFSSHGALDNKGNLYILPYDFNAISLFATALNIKDITNGINGTPCKKMIFMDACHSGEAGLDLLEFASIKDASMDGIVKEIAEAEPGITIMTSSTGKEYSYEKNSWGHGAFTKAILEGLNGKADFNKDKVIYFTELNLYVADRVKELTGGKQHPYTPINLFGNIPIFTLKP
jgi:hypothetical protein